MDYTYNEFSDVLSDNLNLTEIKPHKTNLVLYTRYILPETNDIFMLYILQGESGANYLCDIGSIFDIAEELGLEKEIVEDNAKKFGLSIDNEKIYCVVDRYNVEKYLDDFIEFIKHIGII